MASITSNQAWFLFIPPWREGGGVFNRWVWKIPLWWESIAIRHSVKNCTRWNNRKGFFMSTSLQERGEGREGEGQTGLPFSSSALWGTVCGVRDLCSCLKFFSVSAIFTVRECICIARRLLHFSFRGNRLKSLRSRVPDVAQMYN